MSEAYGTCGTCGLVLATEQDTRAHQAETLAAATPDDHGGRRSHSVSIHKPVISKETRIWLDVSGCIDDALTEVRDSGEFTDDEVRQALGRIDLVELWDELS